MLFRSLERRECTRATPLRSESAILCCRFHPLPVDLVGYDVDLIRTYQVQCRRFDPATGNHMEPRKGFHLFGEVGRRRRRRTGPRRRLPPLSLIFTSRVQPHILVLESYHGRWATVWRSERCWAQWPASAACRVSHAEPVSDNPCFSSGTGGLEREKALGWNIWCL